MAETTITSLMVQHHSVISGLLNKFKDAIATGQSNVDDEFLHAERQIKEHWSIEESVIFDFSKTMDEKRTEIILHLMKEHQIMTDMINTIKNGLMEKDYSALPKLMEMMEKHASNEESVLYPGLDDVLPLDKKANMIKRIEESSGELLTLKF